MTLYESHKYIRILFTQSRTFISLEFSVGVAMINNGNNLSCKCK